jgi:subtilisin
MNLRLLRSRASRVLLPLLLLPLAGCTQKEIEDMLMTTYLVKLTAKPAEVASMVDDITTELGLTPLHIFSNVTQGFQVALPYGLLEQLEGWPGVEYVVIDDPSQYVPPEDGGDPTFTEDEIPDGIVRIGGPATFNVSSVAVAVVDTGADLDHPDLNIVAGVDIVGQAKGKDNGGADENGHGTHVSGTIGAVGNGSGVVGVAPGVPIHAVRVLDADGSGTIGDIVAGLEYVMDTPEIRVVNMSLGGSGDPSESSPLKDALKSLEDAGVVVCIAAGNETADTSTTIPAGYNKGLVVSAYDADGRDNGFAWFSNYGTAVDIAAPGVNITSTYPDNDWTALSGTSMATPHVAGAVAAYLVLNPDATVSEVRQAITSTGENGMQGQGGEHDEPLLDVAALLD